MRGFENGSWYGVVAPVETPTPIIAKLNAALIKTAQNPELKKKLLASGLELSSSTPEEFEKLLSAQFTYWGDTLRAAGIRPEPQ